LRQGIDPIAVLTGAALEGSAVGEQRLAALRAWQSVATDQELAQDLGTLLADIARKNSGVPPAE
jgi:hypothetical protein